MSSKQKIIKYAAMALGLLLAAVLITGGASAVLGLLDAFGGKKIEKMDYAEEFSSDGIKSISFANRDGTMRIVLGDRFFVEGKGVPESFVAKVEKDTLVVSYGKKEHLGLSLLGLNNFSKADITITIPEGFCSETVAISNGTGKIFFEELEGDAFYLENGSGSMEFKGIHGEDIKLENGSGRLTGEEMDAVNLEIHSGSGPAFLTQITAERAEMDQGSGNVSMDQVHLQGFTLSSGSGGFEFEGRIDGDLSVNSGSGRVSFALENSRNEYSIDSDTGSGALWLDGERLEDYSEKNADAKHRIEIDSGSGRVAIEFSGKKE